MEGSSPACTPAHEGIQRDVEIARAVLYKECNQLGCLPKVLVALGLHRSGTCPGHQQLVQGKARRNWYLNQHAATINYCSWLRLFDQVVEISQWHRCRVKSRDVYRSG